MIDLYILPQKAQNELLDFYHFLVERYVSGKRKKQSTSNKSSTEVGNFFKQYNVDLAEFKFNRDELYER